MYNSQVHWGIDLGGTKIEVVGLSDLSSMSVSFRERIATEASQGYEHIIRQIDRLVTQTCEEKGLDRPTHIGIGTPGAHDPQSGLLKNSNTVCLNGQPFLADLSARLEMQVRMANDANCFALAETKFGAATGCDCVFGVILGTGVGGGIVFRGEVWSGLHGIAGEWGHNSFDPQGPECYCGRRGCLETLISGPALERFAGTGQPLREIMAASGPEKERVLGRLIEVLSLALGHVVNLLDPDAIVLGGGVGQIPEIYERLPEALAKHVFNPRCATRLLRPELGDSAGVFGAALLLADAKSV